MVSWSAAVSRRCGWLSPGAPNAGKSDALRKTMSPLRLCTKARATPLAAPALAAFLLLGAAAQPAAAGSGERRALLDDYCTACHNERLETAGLILESSVVDAADVGADAEVWEKVLRKVRSGQMPPAGRRRPEPAAAARFTGELAAELDAVAAAAPDPGRPAVHRLNRTEYVNAVRDLLHLEVDGRALLPADDSGYGFDNNADVLAMSPALLDRYVAAATKIGRLAIGDPAISPAMATYRVPRRVRQTERMSESLPFGTRGGLAVRHMFPLDGEYRIQVRLSRDGDYGIAGLDRGDELEIRLDRRRVRTFTAGGVEELKGLTYDSQEPIPLDRPDLLERKIYDNTADEGFAVRLPVEAGLREVGVAFVRYAGVPEAGGRGSRGPAVGYVEILGPYDAATPAHTPSRERIFVCRPASAQAELPCAREILTVLARRAFRRPVAAGDVDALLGFYEAGRQEGTFDTGIQFALERLLVDPEFLFRVERDPEGLAAGTVYALSDIELASRLSFFLWSSIPDDELLAAAERGELGSPGGLQRQVRRMLADPRAAEMASNFAGQWLLVRNVRFAEPDRALFPAFDGNLRDALARETELLFEDQFRQDRSILDLLRADYTFVNSRLARHYGIPDIYGSHFRAVALADERRHGLLGHGSVLTVTSYPNRTSPVLRGKWVLDNLLGAPPPPPPPDVPTLDEGSRSKPTTVRERLEQHRANPVCASCHARMDPLGFALENFDPIGRWREQDGSLPIDAAADLPDGSTVDGPVAFRKALLERHEEFAGNFAEKLMTYALGRGVTFRDAAAVRAIVREAGVTDYRWSDMVLGIVRSVPFRMRKVPHA